MASTPRAILLLLVCACYDTTPRECTVRCGAGDVCPDDMTCSAGYCAFPGGASCRAGESDAAPGGGDAFEPPIFPDAPEPGVDGDSTIRGCDLAPQAGCPTGMTCDL